MPSLASTTATQMLPSQTKRKVPDESNPLLSVAKRAKKDGKGATMSNKRKLLGAEEQPGGLLIVRGARASPPPSSQPTPGPSAPPTTSKPPSKKFRAGSSQPPAHAISSQRADDSLLDPQIENDVRAMEDEADSLRRNSRAPTSLDYSSGHANGLTFTASKTSINPGFQFPAAKPTNGKSTGKAKANHGQETTIDMIVPLPADDTPQIVRNKRLRASAMAQFDQPAANPPVDSTSGESRKHRRRSSVGRGKRISSSFASTGVISHPHNSVSDTSFYKHIDADLPEPDRIRQLLIWCSSRAAASPQSTPSTTASSSTSLASLSDQAKQELKNIQDDLLHKLAERRIDLSLYGSASGPSEKPQTENAQNVTNRGWEVTYKSQIERAAAEDEAWKKVTYAYETYARNQRAALEKRRAANAAARASSLLPGDGQVPTPLSAKAQGKQREDPDSHLLPREHELSPTFQAGVALAKSILDRDGDSGGPSQQDPGGTRARAGIGNGLGDVEAELMRRIGEVEYKVDFIRCRASALRTMVMVAEEMLDMRFAMLRRALDLRGGGEVMPGVMGVQAEGGADVLRTYVRGTRWDGGMVSGGQNHDPMELLRALARVDGERPPAMVGDAARRAVREVQRVEESGGIGVIGERKLTGVPMTPRKMPGTPRRGNTPGRDRER